jgi:hypothetical protein
LLPAAVAFCAPARFGLKPRFFGCNFVTTNASGFFFAGPLFAAARQRRNLSPHPVQDAAVVEHLPPAHVVPFWVANLAQRDGGCVVY